MRIVEFTINTETVTHVLDASSMGILIFLVQILDYRGSTRKSLGGYEN